MCLYVNQSLTNKIKNLSGKLTVWKNFSIEYTFKFRKNNYGNIIKSTVVGARLKARYRVFEYKAGTYTENTSKIVDGKVNKGLHVCLTEEEAISLGNPRDGYYAVIPLTIDIKDLVAVGTFSDYAAINIRHEHENKQAVVTKFTLSQAKIDKAIKQATAAYLTRYPADAPDIKTVCKR